MNANKEFAISDRRRLQNRMAQRRYRQKHAQEKGSSRKPPRHSSNYNTPPDAPVGSHDESPTTFFGTANSVDSTTDLLSASNAYEDDLGQDLLGFISVDDLYPSPAEPVSQGDFWDPSPSRNQGGVECQEESFLTLSSLSTGDRNDNATLNQRPKACNEGHGWQSPLHIAAQKGHDGIIRMLLGVKTDCEEKDSDGLTPLMLAVIGGHDSAVATFLAHGVRIGNYDHHRRTALHWAIMRKRETALKALLVYCGGEKSWIDFFDDQGRTPLHLAISMGFEQGVKLLLEYGADATCRTSKSF